MSLLFFSGTGTPLSQLDWFHVAGSALFIGASVLQHQSIILLARLRTGKSGELLQLLLLVKTSFCVCLGAPNDSAYQNALTVIVSTFLQAIALFSNLHACVSMAYYSCRTEWHCRLP